jgi:hypothetical protein
MQVTDDDRVHFTPGDKDRIEKEPSDIVNW